MAVQTRTDWFFETQVVDKEETAVFGSEPVCERAGRQQAEESFEMITKCGTARPDEPERARLTFAAGGGRGLLNPCPRYLGFY